MTRLTELIRRAERIRQTEGLTPLLKRASAFAVRRLFRYQTYYLTAHAYAQRDEAEYMPKIQHFTLKVISANREVEELTAEGFDFRRWYPIHRKRLDKGAIAFCIFVEKELAFMGWVAMTDEAKATTPEPPYKVDFLNGEACTSDTWTNPRYRGMGLATYADFKMTHFLKERGRMLHRAAILRDNVVSQRAYAKLPKEIYAEARYLKILWWESCKEKPLADSPKDLQGA